MAKLSSLIGGGGGGASVGYEPADTQDQVLEVNKKYIITSNVYNVRLPNRSDLDVGATVIVKAASRATYQALKVSAFDLVNDIIIYGDNNVKGFQGTGEASVYLTDRALDISASGNEHVFIFTGRAWEYQTVSNWGSGHLSPDEIVLFRTIYTSSGSWVAPATGIVNVTVVGAGGSGGFASNSQDFAPGGGGGGGVIYEQSVSVTEGTTYNFEVGSGGPGSSPTHTYRDGQGGGTSKFAGNMLVANGGAGGRYYYGRGSGGNVSGNVTITHGFTGGQGSIHGNLAPPLVNNAIGATTTAINSGGVTAFPPYGFGSPGARRSSGGSNAGGNGAVSINTEGLYN